MGEAVALLALSGLYSFHLYLKHKTLPKANQELWDRLIAVEEQLVTTREKVNAVQLSNTYTRR